MVHPRMMLAAVVLLTVAGSCLGGQGGSRCHGTMCASGPPGQQCHAKYEGQSKCCPVWHCRDRYGVETTHFGESQTSGGSVVQSMSSSNSYSRSMGNDEGNNFLSGLENMFANMFG